MLVRRWLDAAGITDPVLRHCYTVCSRVLANNDGGIIRWQMSWLASRALPAAARPHMMASDAHASRADAYADSGPVEDRQRRLAAFAEATIAAFAVGSSHDPVLHALVHTYQTFGMPLSRIQDMFTAMQRDVDFRDFATFEELSQWAEQLNTFGWASLLRTTTATELVEVEPLVRQLSVLCQVTDVLCDLSEDLDDGRLYLPLEDLDRFEVAPADLKAKQWTPAMSDLIAFEAARVTDRLPALAAELEHSPVSPFTHAVGEHLRLLVAAAVDAGQDVLHRPVKPPTRPFLNLWRPVMRAVIPC
ncbi:phytoene/squalene synthase family protein [Streptomyces muensis]|uniref:Squalene/phytoene synthase family protein n=1 Tax=Streptomyces muensis TaxID=1077944 RepID=A0A9X1Q2K1_STRM4|nr:squalene/phytoene synthase family protein [Streptomyces muensis]MCF1596869.1 squalene/phytoene synthase family protein [Streptomyces muensis]